MKRFPPYPRRPHSSKQAKIKIDGKPVYLGLHDSPESWTEYRRLLGEWQSGAAKTAQPTPRPTPKPPKTLALVELLLAYDRYAAERISAKQMNRIRKAAGALKPWFATPADEFDLTRLETVQHKFVKRDLSRKYLNSLVGCIRRFFKWGAARKMIPLTVWQEVQLLPDLRAGELGVRDTKPLEPVADEYVAAVLPCLTKTVASVVRLQKLTGMRTGEVLSMRPGDIDRAGAVWIYRPRTHKNAKRGQKREVPLGPQAQEILTPLLFRGKDAFLFSPRDALKGRPGGGRKSLRDHYDSLTYGRAVARACVKAGVPVWRPYQLRHAFATKVRATAGPDAARAALGQKSLSATEIYAQADLAAVAELARKIG